MVEGWISLRHSIFEKVTKATVEENIKLL